ncbi:DUF1702 family protein [Nocardia sp. NPDC051321]|uniref:DUF1702 family protein n=1 Tax=Nocardia sp. NPDC051321 TaxID=3364323 RepID=UPI0037A72BCD
MTPVGAILKRRFTVAPSSLPALPGPADPTGQRLRQVVRTVAECCQLSLLHSRPSALIPRLDAYPDELRGFAYEGAGVGLAALDYWFRWKQRTRDFVAGPAGSYEYAIYLGAGMGLARMGRDPEPFRRRLRDEFSWVVLDGYGFHEGFFAYRHHVQERAVPRHLSGYGLRAFDHGLGRSIWFAAGADVKRVVTIIGAFPEHRRGDLWAGIGLACGYTGGVERATIESLRERAGSYRPRLAEGAVVAARARHQVGNPAPHNEIACSVLCGIDSAQAAEIAADALTDLPTDDVEPAYEIWRERLRGQFTD